MMTCGINLVAVIVAGLLSFFLGGFWYSPSVFGSVWNRAEGRGDDMGPPHSPRVYGISAALAIVGATVFACWLGPHPSLRHALSLGLAVGLGLVMPCFGINYFFAGRSWKLWLIDGGYHTVQFVLYGLVLGLWPA